MRSIIVVTLAALLMTATAMAAGPAVSMGKVEAVYHEGVMTFNVNHPDAVSASVKVYDTETDAVLFDSGARLNTTVTWPAGHEVEGTYRYVVTAWNEAGEVVVSQVATKSLTPINSFDFDYLTSDTRLLGPAEVIVDSDLQVADPEQFRVDRDICGSGIGVYWRDEAGGTNMTIEPDCTGDGIFLSAGATGTSFTISNQATANQTQAGFFGTSSFQIVTGNTGTSSVQMPADAVEDTEILDEPGVAQISSGSGSSFPNPGTILARTISPPTSGYILAIATFDVQVNHFTGTTNLVTCGLSQTTTTIPTNGDHSYYVDDALPTGIYQDVMTIAKIFTVPAGSDTFYVTCNTSGTATFTTFDRHLDLLFVPTQYGTVTEQGGEAVDEYGSFVLAPPMTPADYEAEYTESVAANLARIQAELDAIQAQMDAAAAELVNNP